MTFLGRYQILDKLGAGSMGVVYRARDTLLERDVALKTILTGAEVDLDFRERFYREARACARLQHPSIVVVYDLGESDRVAYIAMELLDGTDLRKIIDRRTAIPLTTKLDIMSQVCEALAYAHRHRIVHRDIKPSNLFLTVEQRAKVLDFGIARLPSSRLTLEGMVLGTPNYMAPEQISVQPCDSRTDLFSAAVVFFELLVHVHPFQAEVIPRRIADGQPDVLSSHDPKLPPVLDRIFARGLAKDPTQRYRTGDDFAADLRCVLGVLQGTASPALSDLRLPSEREVFVQRGEISPMGEADDSTYRTRLAELMKLIDEFDEAFASVNLESARAVFEKISALGSLDPRLADAGELYRGRLAELEKRPLSVVGCLPERDPSTGSGRTAKICTYCGASNRGAAVYCIECGADVSGEAANRQPDNPGAFFPPNAPVGTSNAAAAPSPAQVFPEDESASPVLSPAPLPHAPPSNQTASPFSIRGWAKTLWNRSSRAFDLRWIPGFRAWLTAWPPSFHLARSLGWRQIWNSPHNRRVLLWSGCGVAGMILIVIAIVSSKPIPVEPFMATARVASSKANIFKKARVDLQSEPVSLNVPVHILKLPDRRDQEWVRVQTFAGGKPGRSGFMRVSDLAQWDSSVADAKLALILILQSPADVAGTDDRGTLAALQETIDRFPETRAARMAHLERARIQSLIARNLKAQGQSVDSLQQLLISATADLDAGAGESTSAVPEIRSLLEDLRKEPPPAPPAQEPGKDPEKERALKRTREIDKLIAQADKLWQDRNTEQTQVVLDKILTLQPDNQHALELQNKVARRREYLKTYK